MAKIIIECNPCDQGQYGSTSYYCSECFHYFKEKYPEKCPHCKIVFDEESDFIVHPGFGGSDF